MKKSIKVGSDFSGVGAFNQALNRLGIKYDEIFACDMDKYARQTFELNYGPISYFPNDVYEREIPKESLDIYMTSPPCQSFSLAGKRLGKQDKRGILFFNSLEFIQKNNPRYFIFENVKGLLSHDKEDKKAEYGRTFQEWINYLGGKSVNGVHTFFPYEDSVPYHIYFQVLNAKHYGIPQNRERIFIIGIRDDEDNDFQFPKPFPLEKRLKDVLESEVDEKYFLSDTMLTWIDKHREKRDSSGKYPYTEDDDLSGCITARYNKMGTEDVFIGTWRTHEDGKGFRPTEDNNCPTIPARAREDGSGQPVIKVNQLNPILESGGKQPYQQNRIYSINGISTTLCKDKADILIINANNSKGFDEAEAEEDSINFSVPNSKTRRGRVGKKVSQTLDTQCNQGIVTKNLFNTHKSINFDGILKLIDNEKRNTAKVLLMLQQEIGKTAIETWGLRILEIIRQKTLLQQRLYEESIHSKRQKSSRTTINKIQQTESIKIDSYVIMRSLPKEGWERCSSQRRKSIKQLIRQLNESLQKLSYENSQTNSDLQSGELQYKNKGIRILRETLSKIQEIQQPINKQIQGQRIRRLTPTEAFRLMDFNFNIPGVKDFVWNVSDSQAYKQAGNSICVGVLAAIIEKLKL
jgi:DNA (cytosine-5)-methyltransferase 1